MPRLLSGMAASCSLQNGVRSLPQCQFNPTSDKMQALFGQFVCLTARYFSQIKKVSIVRVVFSWLNVYYYSGLKPTPPQKSWKRLLQNVTERWLGGTPTTPTCI